VTLFFALNQLAFAAPRRRPADRVSFFVWVSIFGVVVIAQLWRSRPIPSTSRAGSGCSR